MPHPLALPGDPDTARSLQDAAGAQLLPSWSYGAMSTATNFDPLLSYGPKRSLDLLLPQPPRMPLRSPPLPFPLWEDQGQPQHEVSLHPPLYTEHIRNH